VASLIFLIAFIFSPLFPFVQPLIANLPVFFLSACFLLSRCATRGYYQDGSVTTRDIANSLGRPKGTVDGNLKRGRDRMGKELIKLCFEADDLEESYLGWPHSVDRSRSFSQTGSEQTEEQTSS
jgi:hypothetical protein